MPTAFPIIGARASAAILNFHQPLARREPGFVLGDLPAMLRNVHQPAERRTDDSQSTPI